MSIILHPVLKIVGTGRGYLHGGADNGYPCSSKVLIQDSDFVVFFFFTVSCHPFLTRQYNIHLPLHHPLTATSIAWRRHEVEAEKKVLHSS